MASKEGQGQGRRGEAWAATYRVGGSAEVSQLLSLALVGQLMLKVKDLDVATVPAELLELLDTAYGPVYGPMVPGGEDDTARALADRGAIQAEAGAHEGSLSLGGGVLLEIAKGARPHALDGVGVDSEPFLAVVLELVGVDLGVGLVRGAGGVVLLGGLLMSEDGP